MLNFNSSPYFDDYDSAKGYHRILYRGGMPVQTRELTQMQTILQNQIKSFGDYSFKNGQVIIPGAQTYSDDVYLCVVTLEEGKTLTEEYLQVGKKYKGEATRVIMELCYWNAISDKKVEMYFLPYASTEDSVADNPIAGTETDNKFEDEDVEELKTFIGGESIYLVPDTELIKETATTEGVTVIDENGDEIPQETVQLTDNAIPIFGTIDYDGFSPATLAKVQKGIYYINGFFVECSAQTLIVDKSSHKPSATVGFYIVEEIASAGSEYPDLYDNSVGYESEGSTGAHRYKISLVLSLKGNPKYDNDYDFVTLSMIDKGEVTEDYSKLNNQYDWLYELLARRTYEESGNYTVKEYLFDVSKQIDVDDDGIETENPDVLKFTASRGESYVGGWELDNTKNSISVTFNKARSEKSFNNALIDVSYGNYILITDVNQLPDVNTLITFSNKPQNIIVEVDSDGNEIKIPVYKPAKSSDIVGYAHIYNVEKEVSLYKEDDVQGSPTQHVWRVYIYDAQFNDGKSINDVRSVYGKSSATDSSLMSGSIVGVVTYSGLSYSDAPPFTYKQNTSNTKLQNVTNTLLGYKDSEDISVRYAYVLPWQDKTETSNFWFKEKSYVTFDAPFTPAPTATIESTSVIQDASNSAYLVNMSSGVTKETSDYSCYVRKTYRGSTTDSGTTTCQIATADDRLSNFIALDESGNELTIKDNGNGSVSVSSNGKATPFTLWYTKYTPNASAEAKAITESVAQIYDTTQIRATDALNLGICDIIKLENVSYFPTTTDYDTVKNDGNTVIDVTDQFIFRDDSDSSVRKNCYLIERTGDVGNLDGGLDAKYSAVDMAVTYKYCLPSALNAIYSFSTVSSYINKKEMSIGDKDVEFIADIPSVVTNGENYHLANCLDFRPKYDKNSGVLYGTIVNNTSGELKAVFTAQEDYYVSLVKVGWTCYIGGQKLTVASIDAQTRQIFFNGTVEEKLTNVPMYYSGSVDPSVSIIDRNNEPLANNSYVQMDYTYFLNRKDIVYLQSNGELKVDEGVPADNPLYPEVIENQYQMPIASMVVPAYTASPVDVSITPYINKRYTMKDIGKLETRIEFLEDAMTLSMLEASVQNMNIVDSDTGLNRYKTGYAVDGFSNLNLVDYKDETIGTVDTVNACFKPISENYVLDTKIVDKKYLYSNETTAETYSGNYRIDDGVLSIDWEEELLISQDAASFWINVNPYAVYNWDGALSIIPKVDTWMEAKTVESYEYNFSTNNYSFGANKSSAYYKNLINDLKKKGIIKSDVNYNGI